MALELMKTTFKAVALIGITMAMTMIALNIVSQQPSDQYGEEKANNATLLLPSKRVSRFLAGGNNNNYDHHGRSLKAADHCHKDNEVCDIKYGKNFTCCGNKCFDFTIDKKHCGGCRNKCKFTYDCCDGKCVDKAYDKSHCGRCNNKCLKGQYCVYGMCDYA